MEIASDNQTELSRYEAAFLCCCLFLKPHQETGNCVMNCWPSGVTGHVQIAGLRYSHIGML